MQAPVRLGIRLWAILGISPAAALAASLQVGDLVIQPGETRIASVVGVALNESTFGVSVLVEVVPRAGNRGAVVFTASPPIDIIQLGDPWPNVGTFSTYDTNSPGASSILNGAVDDNGTFVASPLTYSGPIAGFPLTASSDATGVWDLRLSTSVGNSGWEGVATTLEHGVVTVIDTQVPAASELGLLLFSALLLTIGVWILSSRRLGGGREQGVWPGAPVDVVRNPGQ